MRPFDPDALELCVLTSATLMPGRGHRDVALGAIAGGATAVQLRAPELGDEALLDLASELRADCRAAAVAFFVNDRLDVAVAVGADGVHVGQRDDPLTARRRIGADLALGVSVRDTAQARAAFETGADYVAVTVWSTETKPEAEPRGLTVLTEVAALGGPVVGIGGIDACNAGDVLDAGAAGVAVVSAVVAAPDPVVATRELRAVLDAHRRPAVRR
jgi:thiamine-phosphate pyrophosphorylase